MGCSFGPTLANGFWSTKKKVKPKNSAINDHLLLCNHSPSLENFSVLTKENKKFLLELKESLLIMRGKPS